MKTLKHILVLILQLAGIAAFSQRQHMWFERIGPDKGLSQSNVLSIFQDSRGFMWFGTGDGLNKYDGYSYTVYRNDPKNPKSIVSNWATNIIESRNGDLWLSTPDGLSRYDRSKEQFINYLNNPADTNSISPGEILSVLEDHTGRLWGGSAAG